MVDASKAYAEAMTSIVKFLLEDNDRKEKDLQEGRKRTKQFIGYTMAEMRKVILAEVSNLESSM